MRRRRSSDPRGAVHRGLKNAIEEAHADDGKEQNEHQEAEEHQDPVDDKVRLELIEQPRHILGTGGTGGIAGLVEQHAQPDIQKPHQHNHVGKADEDVEYPDKLKPAGHTSGWGGDGGINCDIVRGSHGLERWMKGASFFQHTKVCVRMPWRCRRPSAELPESPCVRVLPVA